MYRYRVVLGMYAHLTIDVAGGPGVNPEAMEADMARDDRQRNAGEHVLTRVRQEKMISKTPISGWAWN